MENYIEEPTKVYIEIDKSNNIIKIFSSDFKQPKDTSIKIDEGFGDKFRHAQSQYFDKPLINEDGEYCYAYSIEGGVVYERVL
jgi:hypothetical protein